MLFVAGIAVASQGGMQMDREPVARTHRSVGAVVHAQRPGSKASNGGSRSDPGPGGGSNDAVTGSGEETEVDLSSPGDVCNAAIARVKGSMPGADHLGRIEWAIGFIAEECGSLPQAKGLLTALEAMRAHALRDPDNGGSPNGGSPNGGSPNGGSLNGGSPNGGSPNGGSPNGGSAHSSSA
jgi:hypothetical protein